jgi:hypothetical protein
MADDEEFDPEDYEGVSERNVQLPRREIRRFEKDRRERDQLRAQLAESQRLLAFAQAGINATDPAARYFVKGYDGDMDPDAIRAAAVEARVITVGSPVSAEEVGGHAALAAASGGGQPVAQDDEVARQLAEVAKTHWRNADQAIPEIMRIVDANNIKLHVNA